MWNAANPLQAARQVASVAAHGTSARIVGRWRTQTAQADGSHVELHFFADGTMLVSITRDGLIIEQAADYRFVDDTHVRVNYADGSIAIHEVVAVSADTLTLRAQGQLFGFVRVQ